MFGNTVSAKLSARRSSVLLGSWGGGERERGREREREGGREGGREGERERERERELELENFILQGL